MPRLSLVHIFLTLASAALHSNESVWSGERDYRYVNCRAICSFACEHEVTTDLRSRILADFRINSFVYGTPQKTPPWFDLGYAKDNYEETLTKMIRTAHERAVLGEPGPRVSGPVVPSLAVGFDLVQRAESFFDLPCSEGCKFSCALRNSEERRETARQQVKYHGKWAFRPVAGCVEIFSSLSSLLNGLPHFVFLVFTYLSFKKKPKYRPQVCRFPYLGAWLVYSTLWGLAWAASAVFHCRDNRLTESVDYFCALLALNGTVCFSALHLLGVNSRRPDYLRRFLTVALPFLTIWVLHVSYMTFVQFDYDWNMTLGVVLGLLNIVLWTIYWWRTRRVCRHAWMPPVLSSALAPLLFFFEINDFPPMAFLVDAHAMWHITSIPVTLAWYLYLGLELSHYEQHHHEQQQHAVGKKE
jgi:hypothetical protein